MNDLGPALQELADANPGLEIVTQGDLPAERAHDWWMRGLIERRKGTERRAGAVVRPSSTEEVSAVLAWAQATRTAVVPYGLGSGVCGGVSVERDQIVLDTANMAKLVAVDHAIRAVYRAMQTFGGYGYAREYDVERWWREVNLIRLAPVTQEMALHYVGEHVLGLPRSYA